MSPQRWEYHKNIYINHYAYQVKESSTRMYLSSGCLFKAISMKESPKELRELEHSMLLKKKKKKKKKKGEIM